MVKYSGKYKKTNKKPLLTPIYTCKILPWSQKKLEKYSEYLYFTLEIKPHKPNYNTFLLDSVSDHIFLVHSFLPFFSFLVLFISAEIV